MPLRRPALASLALSMFLVFTTPLAMRAHAWDLAERLRQALAAGQISLQMTEPGEIRDLLGPPLRESPQREGGMSLVLWEYADFTVAFGRRTGSDMPLVMLGVRQGETMWEVGRDRPLAPRTAADLTKLDPFTGLQNVDLRRLDLRALGARLKTLSYDTRTLWPGHDSLPEGFDPAAALDRGKDPGLGIRALHALGIDGRGVGIAIIDQPLLVPHAEYATSLARLDTTGLGDFPPQMHGPAVLSAAAGLTCGVAPRARVAYFAVPMWESSNRPYVAALEKVFALNRTLPAGERIRVVSISNGDFARQADSTAWVQVRERATREGVLLLTCEGTPIRYGMLQRERGADPDDPRACTRDARYSSDGDAIRVPGTRTLASPAGAHVYTFFPSGGMSWGAPYLAGLAALACQVRPDVSPGEIVAALVATATRTAAGPVVNPKGFIERLRR
jgi:hypothetical protein